jgi:hypothetical protein
MRHALHLRAAEELPAFGFFAEDRETARRDDDLFERNRHFARWRRFTLRTFIAHDEQRITRTFRGAQRVFAQQLIQDLARLRGTWLRAHDHVARHDVVAVDEPQPARLQLA